MRRCHVQHALVLQHRYVLTMWFRSSWQEVVVVDEFVALLFETKDRQVVGLPRTSVMSTHGASADGGTNTIKF